MKSVLLAFALVSAACSSTGRTPEPERAETVHHEAAGALGPYSALVEAGDSVYVAGRIGDTRGEFEKEVETAIFAVEVELARADLALSDVVQSTCYLSDIALYERFNAVYAARWPKPYPARAVVGVSGLPAGARVEIAVVARAR